MAGLLVLFAILEKVWGPLQEKRAALFSDNLPTVEWVDPLASKHLSNAAHLIRALVFRLKVVYSLPLKLRAWYVHDFCLADAMFHSWTIGGDYHHQGILLEKLGSLHCTSGDGPLSTGRQLHNKKWGALSGFAQ